MNCKKSERPKKFPGAKNFWKNISYLQAQRDLTNRQVAKIMGISASTLQNRKNKPQRTTMEEAEKAAVFFGIEIQSMFIPFAPVEVEPYEPEDDCDE